MSERDDDFLRALGEHFRPEPLSAARARELQCAAKEAAAARARPLLRLPALAAAGACALAAAWLLRAPRPVEQPSPALVAWADEVVEADPSDATGDAWMQVDLPPDYEEIGEWLPE